jgi:hypothetical protein
MRLYIMMNPVRDILTTKIVGFEKPIRDSFLIGCSNCEFPVKIRKNKKIIEVGKVISANHNLEKIKQIWWLICDIQLNENVTLKFMNEYINNEEGVFLNALNGSLDSSNGLNSGYKWNEILINHWKHVWNMNKTDEDVKA